MYVIINGNEYKNKVDIFVGGSPCQSFSIAGSRGGLDDTRGTLFFEYCRLVKEIQPKVFIYENVKANRPIEMNLFYDVVQELNEKNVSVVILGCTELSRVLQNSAFQNRMAAYETGRQGEDEPKYVDVLEVIAKAAVRQCGV